MFNLASYIHIYKKMFKFLIKKYQMTIQKMAKALNNFQLDILGFKLQTNLKKTWEILVNVSFKNQFQVFLALLKKHRSNLNKNKKSLNSLKNIKK